LSKTKKYKFVGSKGFLMIIILIFFILILTFFFGESGIVEIIKAQNRIQDLRQNIAILQEEKEDLKKEIQELKEDSFALEKKAREKLWLMKKNEKVVVIVRKDQKEEN
jgi:cell division protein FtsB